MSEAAPTRNITNTVEHTEKQKERAGTYLKRYISGEMDILMFHPRSAETNFLNKLRVTYHEKKLKGEELKLTLDEAEDQVLWRSCVEAMASLIAPEESSESSEIKTERPNEKYTDEPLTSTNIEALQEIIDRSKLGWKMRIPESFPKGSWSVPYPLITKVSTFAEFVESLKKLSAVIKTFEKSVQFIFPSKADSEKDFQEFIDKEGAVVYLLFPNSDGHDGVKIHDEFMTHLATEYSK